MTTDMIMTMMAIVVMMIPIISLKGEVKMDNIDMNIIITRVLTYHTNL